MLQISSIYFSYTAEVTLVTTTVQPIKLTTPLTTLQTTQQPTQSPPAPTSRQADDSTITTRLISTEPAPTTIFIGK